MSAYSKRRIHRDALRLRLLEQQGGQCPLCGQAIREDPRAISLDHIIPKAVKRIDAAYNLRATHPLCNSKRGVGP
jgi:5-methylcytosine-specific restriction endonuclease McrA